MRTFINVDVKDEKLYKAFTVGLKNGELYLFGTNEPIKRRERVLCRNHPENKSLTFVRTAKPMTKLGFFTALLEPFGITTSL